MIAKIKAHNVGELEAVPLDLLVPSARNARTHSDEQLAQIAGSLAEFGWTNPVLIDEDNTIIAGHGRVTAAYRLQKAGRLPRGWASSDTALCVRVLGLTEAQKRAYMIADNKLALNAGWDYDLLGSELSELMEQFDASVFGFSPDELNNIIHGWTSDLKVDENATDPGAVGKIKVMCEPQDLEDVLGVIERAVRESGINNVTVAKA